MSDSLKGNCLVAAKSLRDPNFHKTVVLLLEHNNDGATGLIVNRPSSIKVSNALSGHFNIPEMDDVVFVGGPVEPLALLMLHNAELLQESESSPVPGLFIGSDETFEQVLQGCGKEGTSRPLFRIFSGYSGWGPGQLEGEIERGDWLVHPGCCDLLFRADPYEVYEMVMKKVFEANRILPYDTKNAEWN
ncbi:MAG: YqgE/AlgH family protein [Planctomycetaceae bacterium]